ncbi:hypothetical protein ABIA44_002299 [Bradyrhizobium sp. USDA 329]
MPPALVERLPPMVQLPSAPKRERKQPVHLCRLRLRDLQHHAGLAGHGVGGGIDLADLVEPAQRHHHLAIVRRLAADEPGIAALRHQRDLVRGGELADRGDLRCRARAQHQRRAAVEQVALLGDVRLDVGRIGDGVAVADDLAELGDQLGRKRRDRGSIDVHSRVSSQASYRATAARRSRSLIASPSPSSGIAITAIPRGLFASRLRR